LAVNDQFGEKCSSALAVVSAESCGIGAPKTVKAVPGSAWNAALSAG